MIMYVRVCIMLCMYVCMYGLVDRAILYVQNQKLYDAAKEGNLPEALVALDRGANVNWQSFDWVISIEL